VADVLSGAQSWHLATADALDFLRSLPDGCVHCCISSPPYHGLRDYSTGKWEGGDPACDHKRPGREQRYFNGQGWEGKRGGAPSSQRSAEPYPGTCGRCGARRVDRQIGLEQAADCAGWATGAPCGACYVCRLVAVFREVRRVLHDTGVCWVN